MQVRLKPAESDRAHPSSPWELDSKRSELLQLNYYRSSGSEGLPNYSVDNNTQLNILFPGQTVIHQIEAPPDVLPYLQFRVQGTVSRRHLFFCEETFTMPETFTKPLVLRALLDFNSVPVFEPLQETLKSMPKFDANTSLADIKEFAGVLTSNVDRIKALKEALNKVYLDHKLNWFKAHIRGSYIFLNRVSAALVSMQNAIASHDSDKIAAESSSIQALETEAAQLERETREIMGKHAVSDQELRYTRVDDVKQALRTASRFKSESDAPNIQTAADELDLHAMTVEEAIPLVDRYLEDSYNANKRRVWIVHGKGTGVLRTEVGRHLKGHKLVKSFAIAGNDRGGEGATQVDLID
jgi:DNA-nicking Smr family endonuclease